jgi:hypothetical protein
MTDHELPAADPIADAVARLIAASRAIDSRAALRGIPIRRLAPKHETISRKRRTIR